MYCDKVSATLLSMAVRCLIVDDNRSFLETARTLLEREGVAVVGVASTSAQALRETESVRPDIVLVDVALGEESGFELARRLVADHDRGPTVILISTRSEADLADLIALSPAAGFLSKSDLSAEAIRGFLDR
jgi:DNA-binding NarL/FixJ family response regulator